MADARLISDGCLGGAEPGLLTEPGGGDLRTSVTAAMDFTRLKSVDCL